jgi:hypothetical protein
MSLQGSTADTLSSLDLVLQRLELVIVDLAQTEKILDELVAAGDADPAIRQAKQNEILTANWAVLQKTWMDLRERMAAVEQDINKPDASLRIDAPLVKELVNQWQPILSYNLVEITEPGATLDQARLRGLATAFRDLRRKVAQFTIPRLVPFRVGQLRSGASLDFHREFERKLDVEPERLAILAALAGARPSILGGIVDLPAGRIYRVGDDLAKFTTGVLLVGGLAIGWLILAALNRWGAPFAQVNAIFQDTQAHDIPLETLLPPYIWLAVGVAAHVIKQGISLSRAAQGTEASPAPGLVFLWVHVRQWQFFVTILIAVAAFILVWALAGAMTLETAFFLGYTIDSVSDLVVSRYSTIIASQSAAVSKAVKAALA